MCDIPRRNDRKPLISSSHLGAMSLRMCVILAEHWPFRAAILELGDHSYSQYTRLALYCSLDLKAPESPTKLHFAFTGLPMDASHIGFSTAEGRCCFHANSTIQIHTSAARLIF